jgi:hemolysin III
MPTFEASNIAVPRPAEHRPADEHANLLTHGLGLLLSVLASSVLMTVAINERRESMIAACAVYCCSLVCLYWASTMSHMFYDPTWRRFFRTMDQACIYLLIAGSFTPYSMIFLRNQRGMIVLAAMWSLAIVGVILVLRKRNLSPGARATYLVLGWLPIVEMTEMLHTAPPEVLVWLIAGGVFYSAGMVFLRFDERVRYCHALWHTFVIAGSTCHYRGILLMLLQ